MKQSAISLNTTLMVKLKNCQTEASSLSVMALSDQLEFQGESYHILSLF